MTRPAVPETDVRDALREVEQGALLLDVGEPQEWLAGHAPGAVHLPLGLLGPGTARGQVQ